MNRMAVVWRFHFLNCPAFKSKAVSWASCQFPFALHHSPWFKTHHYLSDPQLQPPSRLCWRLSRSHIPRGYFPRLSHPQEGFPVLPFPQQDTHFVCSDCSGKFQDKRTDCAGEISFQGGLSRCGNWALPGPTGLTLKGRLFLQLCNLPWSLKLSFPSVKQTWGYWEDYLGEQTGFENCNNCAMAGGIAIKTHEEAQVLEFGAIFREKDQVQRLKRCALLQMLELL